MSLGTTVLSTAAGDAETVLREAPRKKRKREFHQRYSLKKSQKNLEERHEIDHEYPFKSHSGEGGKDSDMGVIDVIPGPAP